MSAQCKCNTIKGVQCTKKSSKGSKYCHLHQACTKPISQKKEKKKNQTKKHKKNQTKKSSVAEYVPPVPPEEVPSIPDNLDSKFPNMKFHTWMAKKTKVNFEWSINGIADEDAFQRFRNWFYQEGILVRKPPRSKEEELAFFDGLRKITQLNFGLNIFYDDPTKFAVMVHHSDGLMFCEIRKNKKGDDLVSDLLHLMSKSFIWEWKSGTTIPNWQEEQVQKEKEDEGICTKIDTILEDFCEVKITQDIYFDFAQHRSAFLASFLRQNGACFVGDLAVVSSTRPDVKELVIVRPLSLRKCHKKHTLEVVLVGWLRGDFDDRSDMMSNGYKKETSGHANALIINHSTKMMIYFEPHGDITGSNSAALQSKVFEEVQDTMRMQDVKMPDYTFLSTSDSCPYFGPQAKTGDGYCGNWSVMIPALHALCPKIDIRTLQEQLTAKGTKYLVMLMEHFHCFMWKWVKDRGILDAQKKLDTLQNERNSFEPITLEDYKKKEIYYDAFKKVRQAIDEGEGEEIESIIQKMRQKLIEQDTSMKPAHNLKPSRKFPRKKKHNGR
jgi:hypothetical protein